MESHESGIHSDKIVGDISYYYPKYRKIPHNLFGRSAQLAKIFGIFEKKNSLGVRSPCCLVFRHTIIYEAAFPFM